MKRFDTRIRTEGFIGQPFKDNGIPRMLEDFIRDSGLRNIDHKNPHKRKEIPLSHGFRNFFTKQLVDSKLNPEIREMLLGHKIGIIIDFLF